MTHSEFFDSPRQSPSNHTAECVKTRCTVGQPPRTAQLVYTFSYQTTEFSMLWIIIKDEFLQHGCAGATHVCVVAPCQQMLSSKHERMKSRLNCLGVFLSAQTAENGGTIVQTRARSKAHFGSMAKNAGEKFKIVDERKIFIPEPAFSQ